MSTLTGSWPGVGSGLKEAEGDHGHRWHSQHVTALKNARSCARLEFSFPARRLAP
jgi:hypothetical protein